MNGRTFLSRKASWRIHAILQTKIRSPIPTTMKLLFPNILSPARLLLALVGCGVLLFTTGCSSSGTPKPLDPAQVAGSWSSRGESSLGFFDYLNPLAPLVEDHYCFELEITVEKGRPKLAGPVEYSNRGSFIDLFDFTPKEKPEWRITQRWDASSRTLTASQIKLRQEPPDTPTDIRIEFLSPDKALLWHDGSKRTIRKHTAGQH